MAEKLKKYEFPERPGRYPWDDWMDGGIWRLEKGTDFTCQIGSFVAQAHGQARHRGGQVRTHTEGSAVVIQFGVGDE